MKNNKLAILLRGIITENPVLILILGTCPTLAVTGNVTSAISMGLAATVVLICSNIVISALRKVIPDTVRVPCYIVIIATFVTAVQMLLQAFLPPIYEMLGVYLALIVVNCVILGRAEMYASKNKVVDSAIDAVGMGIGFTLALFLMSSIREILGSGTYFGFEIPFLADNPIMIFSLPAGGFFVFGCLIAIVNKITKKKGGKKLTGCEGCPSAFLCGKKREEICGEGDDK